MDKHYHHTLITALIETIASWTDADQAIGSRRCSAATASPAARSTAGSRAACEPLRGWRPGGATPALLACSCPRGRCHICN